MDFCQVRASPYHTAKCTRLVSMMWAHASFRPGSDPELALIKYVVDWCIEPGGGSVDLRLDYASWSVSINRMALDCPGMSSLVSSTRVTRRQEGTLVACMGLPHRSSCFRRKGLGIVHGPSSRSRLLKQEKASSQASPGLGSNCSCSTEVATA
jgi:hypothetical protein